MDDTGKHAANTSSGKWQPVTTELTRLVEAFYRITGTGPTYRYKSEGEGLQVLYVL